MEVYTYKTNVIQQKCKTARKGTYEREQLTTVEKYLFGSHT